MAAKRYVLAVDQGTTSSRAILFDATGRPVTSARKELRQIYPADGWVEHDPEDIWRDTLSVCREAIAKSHVGVDAVAAIGITNQRETSVLWDRASGRPVMNAIVWLDRRTAEACRRLKADRKSVVEGKEVSVRVDSGGRRIM